MNTKNLNGLFIVGFMIWHGCWRINDFGPAIARNTNEADE